MAGIGATVALIKALAPKADPAVIQQAVEDYLEAHPEISVADGSITEEKLAADVAEILDDLQDDVTDVKNAIHQIGDEVDAMNYGGKILTDSVKTAIIDLFNHVAFTDGNAQTYIQSLETAWGSAATLNFITAIFTQGSAVIYENDSLDTLTQYLAVTGNYSIGQTTYTEAITNYTLSGTLEEGTSTITVTYENKTATFTVNVTSSFPSEYQKVEYIGASGSQGVVFDDIKAPNATELAKYEYDIDCKFDEWNSVSGTNIVASFGSNGGMWLGYNNSIQKMCMGTDSGCYFSDTATTRHQYNYKFANGTGTIVRDDEESVSRAFSSSNATVFALFGVGGVRDDEGYLKDEYGFAGKIYAFSIKRQGTEIHNLVPCYRKADNVIGFYDTVTETFYTNAGIGSFTKGSDL